MAPLTLSVDVKSSSATSHGKFSLSVFIIDCEFFSRIGYEKRCI